MVFWKVFSDHFRDHVVQVDFPQAADRSATEPGMEVPVAYFPGKSVTGDHYCHFRLAFLGQAMDIYYEIMFFEIIHLKYNPEVYEQ